MTARLRIVRRNGNLVTRLIGDLLNRRNGTANPVHRHSQKMLLHQQLKRRRFNSHPVSHPFDEFVSPRMSLSVARVCRGIGCWRTNRSRTPGMRVARAGFAWRESGSS
jgi:hypothetical protein